MASTEIIYLLISLNIIFLILGIVIGFFLSYFLTQDGTLDSSFIKKKKYDKNSPGNTISIDEKKVVVQVKTDDLEKKYDTLGTVTQTQENISSSVNKLKNLKG